MSKIPQQERWNALRKIVKHLPTHLAYYGAALGAIAIAGSAPEGMVSIVGNIGAGILTNLIADIVKGADIPDEDMRQRAEEAIIKSDIANLLTKQDFLQGYARLIHRLDDQKVVSQELLDELQAGFSKVATAEQVEELKQLILAFTKPTELVNEKKIKVFISYSRKDGFEDSQTLRQRLKLAGFDVWQDLIAMNIGENWHPQIFRAIEQVDALVMVLTSHALKSPMVRQEWIHARRVGTPIFPIAFSDLYKEASVPGWVSKVDAVILSEDVVGVAEKWQSLITQLRTPRTTRRVPNMVDRLPDEYVERQAFHKQILAALLDKSGTNPRHNENNSYIVTLLAEGGMGKTTLAQAVGLDIEVNEVFTGGIFFITIGENGTQLLDKWNTILWSATGEEHSFSNPINQLRLTLQGDDFIIILDDVWERTHIEPILRFPRCTYLITTRDNSVAALASGRPLFITEMEPNEARDVLIQYIPDEQQANLKDAQRDALRAFGGQLGEWPLLLDIHGWAIREECQRGSTVEQALAYVQEGLREEGLDPFPRGSSDDIRRRTLQGSMNASLRRFTEEEKQRLYELSIFPDDTSIPESVILGLWKQTGDLSNTKAKNLLRRLSGHFYKFHIKDIDKEGPMILRIHDRIREYLGQQHANPANTHTALLASYGVDNWTQISDYDGYIFDHLAYHISRSAHPEQIHELINRNFMAFRHKPIGAYNKFADDVQAAIKVQEDTGSEGLPKLLAYNLLHSSLYTAQTEVPLSILKLWTKWGHKDRAVHYAKTRTEPLERVRALLSIGRGFRQRFYYDELPSIVPYDATLLKHAYEELRYVEDEDSKLQILFSLPIDAAHAGESQLAFDCAYKTKQLSEYNRQKYWKEIREVWERLPAALAASGKLEEVYKAIDVLYQEYPDAEYSTQTFTDTALNLIKHDHIAGALRIGLSSLKDEPEFIQKISDALMIRRDECEQAIRNLREIADPDAQSLEISEVARRIDQLTREIRWEEKQRDKTRYENYLRESSQSLYIGTLEWLGSFTDCIEQILKFGGYFYPSPVSPYFLDTLFCLDRDDDIAAVRHKLIDHEWYDEFEKSRHWWDHLFFELSRSPSEALNSILEMEGFSARHRTLVLLTPRMVALGMFERLKAVLRDIEHDFGSIYVIEYAVLLARTGNISEALLLCHEILDDHYVMEAFVEISGILIGRNEIDKFYQYADKIFPDRSTRLEAIAQACSRLDRIDDKRRNQAKEILEDALRYYEGSNRSNDAIDMPLDKIAIALADYDIKQARRIADISFEVWGSSWANVMAICISRASEDDTRNEIVNSIVDTVLARGDRLEKYDAHNKIRDLIDRLLRNDNHSAAITFFDRLKIMAEAPESLLLFRLAKVITPEYPERAAILVKQALEIDPPHISRQPTQHVELPKHRRRRGNSDQADADDYYYRMLTIELHKDVFAGGWVAGWSEILDELSTFKQDKRDELSIIGDLISLCYQDFDLDMLDMLSQKVVRDDWETIRSSIKLYESLNKGDCYQAITNIDADVEDGDSIIYLIMGWAMVECEQAILIKLLDVLSDNVNSNRYYRYIVIACLLELRDWDKARYYIEQVTNPKWGNFLRNLLLHFTEPNTRTDSPDADVLLPFMQRLLMLPKPLIHIEQQLGLLIAPRLEEIVEHIRTLPHDAYYASSFDEKSSPDTDYFLTSVFSDRLAYLRAYCYVLMFAVDNHDTALQLIAPIHEKDEELLKDITRLASDRLELYNSTTKLQVVARLLEFARSHGRDFLCSVLAKMIPNLIKCLPSDQRHNTLIEIYNEIAMVENLWRKKYDLLERVR